MQFPITLIISGVFFLVGSSYFLALGIRGLRWQRPFLVPARQQMWFLLCFFVPLYVSMFSFIVNSFNSSFDTTALTLYGVTLVSLVITMMAFLWQYRGYIAYGVSDTSFREALCASFHRLHLPFEERPSQIHLPDNQKDLHVAIAEWMGTAQIRFKGKPDAELFQRIVREVNRYYEHNPGDINKNSFIRNTILGTLSFFISLGMFWWAFDFYIYYL